MHTNRREPNMKKIGILGGLAWPATVEYYKAICELSQKHHADAGLPGPSPMPEMCIESVNINYSFNRRGTFGDEESWKAYDAYFHTALKRLQDNGVDFAIIASNTPHNRFDAITKGLRIPVLSIFEAVAATCKAHGVSDCLILGTEPTMDSGIFPGYLKRHGVNGFAPPEAALKAKVTGLISELFKGKSDNGSARIDEVVRASCDQTEGKQSIVCLACTELPLAFEGKEQCETFHHNGVFYLNTTMIHANATFRYAVEGEGA